MKVMKFKKHSIARVWCGKKEGDSIEIYQFEEIRNVVSEKELTEIVETVVSDKKYYKDVVGFAMMTYEHRSYDENFIQVLDYEVEKIEQEEEVQ